MRAPKPSKLQCTVLSYVRSFVKIGPFTALHIAYACITWPILEYICISPVAPEAYGKMPKVSYMNVAGNLT